MKSIKNWIFVFLTCCFMSMSAQETGKVLKYNLNVPSSVYASYLNAPLDSLNKAFPEFPTLNTSLNFLRFSKIDLDRGYLEVPIQNMKDLSMQHFYDTYQELHINTYIRKSFLKPWDSYFFNIKQYKEQFK